MLRIVEHLERLLSVHDCVIVPQLGGFVLQTVPASYVMEEHLFRPGYKEVVFNPSLVHNDGLLPELYMNVYNVTFQKARRMLEEDVEEINNALLKGLKISLGNVGTLCIGEERQIVFQAGDTGIFCVDSYGLSPFRLETWQAMLEEEPVLVAGRKKNIFYIPVNRNIVRGIASTAAAIALFLMISTPVKEINPSSYTASFVPTEIVKTNKKAIEDTPGPAIQTATLTPTATTAAARPKSGNTGVGKKEVLPAYYVVISSVKTKKQAEEILSKADRSVMKNVNKVIVNDNIRIYADKFTDKNKAEVYLAKIRKNSNYKDAWIYTRNK
ncbi:MAG: SPOR domain-containing protein [Tannerellaceae bacterium]|jgi:hypothetical protein|nr:SPOR domain-containing protein [Tannerellaceae bacterium]